MVREILNEENEKARAEVITHFIKIAKVRQLWGGVVVSEGIDTIHVETMFFTLAAFTPHFAPLVIVQVDRVSLSTVAIPVAPFLY